MAEDISRRTVFYSLPGTDAVRVENDGPLDLYLPAASTDAAVIIVAGYPDAGYERIVGRKFKDMGCSVSWSRLIAASGVTAVTYTHDDPAAAPPVVFAHLRERGIRRFGLWASSGNAPLAMSMLLREAPQPIECAALLYPYTFSVPPEAKRYGFATPADDRSADDLATGIPMLVVRAGSDATPGLNATLDRFIADALRCNLPISVINLPPAEHAFDLLDPDPRAGWVIAEVLGFLRAHLPPG